MQNTKDESNPDNQDGRASDSDHRFETYLASDQMLLEEIRDQHNETLGLVNSLVQRSGIVMAFNSMFLIELFNLQSTGNIVWMITTVSTLIGMLVGLIAVIDGRLISPGTKIDKVVRIYNVKTYEDLVPAISNGKLRALKKSTMVVELISDLVLIQTIFLLTSVIGLIILEV